MQEKMSLKKARGVTRKSCLTKLSRITFVTGLTLMALCYCLEDAPMWMIAATGITGSLLALGSMWWTGWMDTDGELEDE